MEQPRLSVNPFTTVQDWRLGTKFSAVDIDYSLNRLACVHARNDAAVSFVQQSAVPRHVSCGLLLFL